MNPDIVPAIERLMEWAISPTTKAGTKPSATDIMIVCDELISHLQDDDRPLVVWDQTITAERPFSQARHSMDELNAWRARLAAEEGKVIKLKTALTRLLNSIETPKPIQGSEEDYDRRMALRSVCDAARAAIGAATP